MEQEQPPSIAKNPKGTTPGDRGTARGRVGNQGRVLAEAGEGEVRNPGDWLAGCRLLLEEIKNGCPVENAPGAAKFTKAVGEQSPDGCAVAPEAWIEKPLFKGE